MLLERAEQRLLSLIVPDSALREWGGTKNTKGGMIPRELRVHSASLRLFLAVLSTPPAVGAAAIIYDSFVPNSHVIAIASAQSNLADICRNVVITSTFRDYIEKNSKPGYQHLEDEPGNPIPGVKVQWSVDGQNVGSVQTTDNSGMVQIRFDEQPCNDETKKLLLANAEVTTPDGIRQVVGPYTGYSNVTKHYTAWVLALPTARGTPTPSRTPTLTSTRDAQAVVSPTSSPEKNETAGAVGLAVLMSLAALGGIVADRYFFRKLKPKIPEIEQLRAQLDFTSQNNVDLRSKNSTLETQVEGLQKEVTMLNGISVKLNTDNKSLTTQLEQQKVKSAEAVKEVKLKADARINDLQSQLNGARQENAALKSDKATLESQAGSLKEDINHLNQDNVNLRSQNSVLEGQVNGLRSEVDALNKVTGQLNADNGNLTTQVSQLRINLGGAVQENAALKSDKASLEVQASKLKDDIDKLNQEIERVKAEKARSSWGNLKNTEWITEWITGQQDFENRWRVAKTKLQSAPKDDINKRIYVSERFKAGMDVVHEVLTDSTTRALPVNQLATRIKAGIEYLIGEIWLENKIPTKFFDPDLNRGLEKTIFLPETYRNLTKFTEDQKREVRRIHRILQQALHSDKQIRGSDPQLRDLIGTLLKEFNSSWELIDKLLS